MPASAKVISIFRLFKQAVKGDEQDYTSLSIDKAIFLLSIPMILEMAMESMFALVARPVFILRSRLHSRLSLSQGF